MYSGAGQSAAVCVIIWVPRIHTALRVAISPTHEDIVEVFAKSGRVVLQLLEDELDDVQSACEYNYIITFINYRLGLQMQCGVNVFILDSSKVLGRKHISNPDFACKPC